jgi:hypothetical protein|tara:strand:+ start:237 stop:731 length:495 start_codon:yes stop_codon:yes gene_type:complete
MTERKVRNDLQYRQSTFLMAYAVAGSIRAAAESIGIIRDTVYTWVREDKNDFRSKFTAVKEDFREYLQDMAMDRVKAQKPGDNPVLLITLLNAHWPEKYRPNTIVTDGTAKEVMAEWKQWVKNSKKENTSLEVPAEVEEREAELAAKQLFDRKFNDNTTDGANK